MAYADHQDVAAELGRPVFTDDAQIAQVDAWLARTEALILTRIPDLMARVAAGEPTAALVANVEASVVARKVLNPDGTRQLTVAVDDGNVTRLRDGAGRDGALLLTDEEWALLSPPSSAFSVRPVGTDPVAFYPDRWPLRRH